MTLEFPHNRRDALERLVSSLPGCRIHAECCAPHVIETAFIVAQAGDRTVADFLSRLNCAQCGERPFSSALVGLGNLLDLQSGQDARDIVRLNTTQI